MNILVTGGLGFIGSHLVDSLASNASNNVTVIDNLVSESSSRDHMRDDVTYWIDDIRNINTNKYYNYKFDLIYHLAALARIQPSFQDPISYISIDVMGTTHILEFARRTRSKVVYAGSSSAYAGPMLNPYAFAKYTGEQVCEMYHKVYRMSTVTARFFNVYGDRQPRTGPYATVVGVFEDKMLSGDKLPVTDDGEQRRDFTHVNDIVMGFEELGKETWSADIFQFGTGKNYSINELAHLFGGEIEYIPSRPGEARNTLAAVEEVQEIINWKSEHTLEEYIKSWKEKNICNV